MSQTAVAPASPSLISGKDTTKASLLLDTFGLSPEAMSPFERKSAISGYDLRHRIEAMVAGIAKQKIKHIYKGDGAATAPGVMILPRIVATSLFPLRHVRILLGYAAHEISHQLKTEFKLVKLLIDDKTRSDLQKQQIKEFWNAIEDYRIEKIVKPEYPGFHVYIDDTRDFSARRFCERVDSGLIAQDDLANPYRMGSVALTWIGAELNKYVTRTPRDALNHLCPDLLAWAESWRDDMAKVHTCRDAMDLAITIVDDLDRMRQETSEESQDKSEEESSQDQGEAGSQGSDHGFGSNDGTSGNDSADAPKDDASSEGAGENTSDDAAPADGNDEAESDHGISEDKPSDKTGGQDGADDEDSEAADSDPAAENGEDGGAENGDAETGKPEKDKPSSAGDHAGDGDKVDQTPSSSSVAASPGNPSDDQANSAGKNGATETEEASSDAGGAGQPRPRPNFRDGDENSLAEAADLEIDELTEAINSMDGPEARDPDVASEENIATQGAWEEDARRENIARGQAAYAAIRHEVGAPAARSAGILRRLLQSNARIRWNGGKEEGDLDFGRIVGMSCNAPDIYRQKTVRNSVNTAVSLLLDNSGSMANHPIRVCQQTSVVLDMAIQGTKTNVEITGFTGSANQPVLYRYRAFGQKGQAASASLGNMDQVALGGTPVSTPLLEAWRRLSQQKEPRRILIVVSDGGADYNDVEAARTAHDFIISRGCIVLGIAIGADEAMRNWCDNVQSVEGVDDLPIALTNLVKEALK